MIAYIPIENFHEELLHLLKGIMPEYAFQTIHTTIVDTISNKRTGLLSLGFIMTLYFAANGVNSMISAFNASQLAKETRGWIEKRVTSIIIVVAESVLLTLAIGIIVFSQKFFNLMLEMGWIEKNITFYLIVFGKWIVSIALLFFAISFLYYFAPVRKKRFRLISAGSTLATGLLILTSVGFSYYVNNFANYNKIYGSLGTLIVLLLWFYFSSLVLLIGYELNLSIRQYKPLELPKPEEQP
jgi:membrane protein